MNKQDAERITIEYLKPVYGFALKRCRSLQDAEDLSQDIVLRIFTALLKREDIVDVQKYVWTIAHNCLTIMNRNEAERYYQEVIEYEEQEEKRLAEIEQKVIDYVCKLKKDELQQTLLELLFDGPEWQYERFIRQYIE